MPLFVGILLIIATAAYRVIAGFAGADGAAWIVNFAPLAALALCGGAFLPRPLAFIIPLGALFLSDIVLNLFLYSEGLFFPGQAVMYASLALVVVLGLSLRSRSHKISALLGGAIGGAILFYVATSTAAWLANPVYAKSLAGWSQALIIGDPAASPQAWVFFRNSLISDLLFTGVFYLCMMATRREATESASKTVEAPAQATLL